MCVCVCRVDVVVYPVWTTSPSRLFTDATDWGYDTLEGFRENLGFLSNQTEDFQIERWTSGESYFSKHGCFATRQPLKRDHHTAKFCSKWVLWAFLA